VAPKIKKKVRKSRPGVLAKKLRRCKEEGRRSKVGRGGSGHAVTPPSYSNPVNSARTPAVKVVRSTTTSTPSSKKGGASQGVVEEFQWNSSAARTLYYNYITEAGTTDRTTTISTPVGYRQLKIPTQTYVSSLISLSRCARRVDTAPPRSVFCFLFSTYTVKKQVSSISIANGFDVRRDA